jgi:ppGpp synthetase/RelA/SpoT-type nucleotidyltranferase
MAWITRGFSKTQVNKAGKLIGNGGGTQSELADARDKVSNFRSAHAYPLFSVTIHVRKNALALNTNAIVARRLKRLPTIIDKLKRHPNMNVTTMHDLGGCRVILSSVAEVDALVERLHGAKRAQNVITRSYDYLREPGPQDTGYRGIHLVYEYRATKPDFLGSTVEVQIRTDLQHAWATAVETLDLFGGTRLKYGTGDEELKRFFLVVSSLMAVEEGLPQPEAASGAPKALRDELRSLETTLGLLDRLSGYVAIVKQFGSDKRTTFLMRLDRTEHTLYLELFDNAAGAEAKLEEIENQGDDNIDAVLVASSKVGMLKSAYPNYFANTTAFSDFVQKQLDTA